MMERERLGLKDRVTVRTYGTLGVHLPAREDLVCFKLYAAVDQTERSKHFTDLRALEAFVGDLPRIRPDWTRMLNVSRELVTLEAAAERLSPQTLPVHIRTTLRLIEGDLDELGVEPALDDVHGTALWPAVRQLGQDRLGAWSIGRFPDMANAPARTS